MPEKKLRLCGRTSSEGEVTSSVDKRLPRVDSLLWCLPRWRHFSESVLIRLLRTACEAKTS
jgi:hypothetical protein